MLLRVSGSGPVEPGTEAIAALDRLSERSGDNAPAARRLHTLLGVAHEQQLLGVVSWAVPSLRNPKPLSDWLRGVAPHATRSAAGGGSAARPMDELAKAERALQRVAGLCTGGTGAVDGDAGRRFVRGG